MEVDPISKSNSNSKKITSDVPDNGKILSSDNVKEKSTKKTKASNRKLKRKKYAILPSHITSSGTADSVKYECTACGSTFKCEKHISYHIYCNSVKPFSCTQCPKKFVKKSQLRHHLNVHAGIKQFVCDTCNASFYEKHKLITHTQTHTGIKSHKCSKCEAAFYTPHALKEHEAIHLDTKPYSCKTCGAKFSNSSNLKKHEAGHLNLRFYCPTCNKKCRTKYYLQKHSKICTTSFECIECSRSFNTKKDRDRHTLTHSDIKKFHCNICKASFRRRDGVQRHLRNTHPEVNIKDVNTSFSILTEVKEVSTWDTKEVEEKSVELISDHVPKDKTLANSTQVNQNQVIKVADVNDESCSLHDMYKKIFLEKRYEKYIPVDAWRPPVDNTTDVEIVDDYSSDCNEVRMSSDTSSHRNITYETTSDYSVRSSNNCPDIETPLNRSCADVVNEPNNVDCRNNLTTSSHCENTSNYKNSNSFSVNDIIAANKLRQSVIFNVTNTKETTNNFSKSQADESLTLKSTNMSSDINNSKDSSTSTDSHTFFTRDTVSSDPFKSIKYGVTHILPSVNKTSVEPSFGNVETRTEYPRQDYMSRPVYLHKKVNYDQKPIHQQKRYCVSIDLSNKPSHDSRSNSFTENKPLSKEELSELYKKILFPSYKGSKPASSTTNDVTANNVTAPINITPSLPSQTGVTQQNPAKKITVLENRQFPQGSKIPPVAEHWRRRLAYSSENE